MRKYSQGAVAVAAFMLLPLSASAQPTVRGNEAVTQDGPSKMKVELPPAAKTAKGKPMPEATFFVSESIDPKSKRPSFSPWVFMIETPSGLQECMRPWFEAKGCRKSTVGKALAQRFWIVKRNGEWLRCPGAEISRCTSQLSLDPMKSELQ